MNLKLLLIWSIIGTGITSVTTQLITIREFLTQFHGNEITISLVLFCWLLLTGLGSLAAKVVKRSSLGTYAILILTVAVWPLLQIIIIREFREIYFTHGTSPGFYPIFLYILITISPYCLLTGFILPYAQKVLNDHYYHFSSSEIYFTDSIGDISGGILFSFILVYWLKPFPTIALTSTILILISFLILLSSQKNFLLLITILSASLFYYYSTNSHFEKATLANQYGDIVDYAESPYGRIVVSKEGAQHTFWESGLPLYSDSNIITCEEKVHYPLCQLDQVENVLLVSGGLGKTLAEVSKYHPSHIDYVEIDPYLTDSALKLGVLKKAPFLEIMNTDGRQYIKKTKRKYDAIIIDLPDPDTFQINRFFTSEFFSLTKKALKKDGIFSVSIEYSPNYLSDIRKKKLSTIYNTARIYFQNVLVLPGNKAYFLCRDGDLWPNIPARLKLNAIKTSYVEGFYYGNVTTERIKQLEENLDRNEYINTDFEPRLMNILFVEWFTKYNTSPKYFLFGLSALTLIYLMSMRKEEYILFSTGLATMGAEMLIIFTFQIIYGYIYLRIGAIITAFLLGLLPGAIMGSLWKRTNSFKLLFSEILFLALLTLFFVWAAYLKIEVQTFFFLAFCFAFSFLCGFQFPVVTDMIGEKNNPTAGCLAADLCGAALGTLIIGTILIPMLGIQSAVIFLILIKLSSSMIMMMGGKRA